MAEGKNSFVLYTDNKELWEEITDEQAGKLIKHIFRYVTDENPKAPDEMTKLLFIPIKYQLKRDLKKYEAIKEKRSRAGKASAKARQENESDINTCPANPTLVENDKQQSTSSTVSESVSVSESDIKNIYIPAENHILTEHEFLEIWKRARLHYDKLPTNYKTLSFHEKQLLKDLLKDYGKEEIEKAIAGLFFQDTLPNVRIRPTHLLDRQYFETYLDCWNNKTKIYSKDKKKKDNTGMI